VTLAAHAPAKAAAKKFTIALIPGLTTDAFYITMHKRARAAADALRDTLLFQGAPEFNPVVQVPVLDAVIARHPDAILIAPTDEVPLIEPPVAVGADVQPGSCRRVRRQPVLGAGCRERREARAPRGG
jgi:ABC-type sugar transport system substrate-binding protein